MKMLGLETSCDDTSVACVDAAGVRSNLVSSQIELHDVFGGVVPELASRAHVRNVLPVLRAALDRARWELDDVEAVAATAGPGLIGAVLTGLTTAKALSWALRIPFVGVHHIEAHILANGIGADMEFPSLVLVVSGGHTELVRVDAPGRYQRLGITRDDAAGETLDKAAKLMGLGYPGGPQIQRLAEQGTPGRFSLPRAMPQRSNLEFSFSGLKTAVRLELEALGPEPRSQDLADLAHALQEAVLDVLVSKTERALQQPVTAGVRSLALAGGVAANGPLRARFAELARRQGLAYTSPDLAYCTDNAAMVAHAGRLRLLERGPDPLGLPAFARGGVSSWI